MLEGGSASHISGWPASLTSSRKFKSFALAMCSRSYSYPDSIVCAYFSQDYSRTLSQFASYIIMISSADSIAVENTILFWAVQ